MQSEHRTYAIVAMRPIAGVPFLTALTAARFPVALALASATVIASIASTALAREAAPAAQSQVAIAVDEAGQHVVLGFNDFRGFEAPLSSLSLSGYMYSEDGGRTFVDGGQLPTPAHESVADRLLPDVLGVPDVKYLGDCVFVYSSVLVSKFSDEAVVQTLGVHRSTDCGKTWRGPFEVTAATNPNRQVDEGGFPLDAADSALLDVDPKTGRVIISWSNENRDTGVEIRTAYSEDIKTGVPPTWSAGTVVARSGARPVPRFAASNANAYVAWARSAGPHHSIAFARSLDNGLTWQPPIEAGPEFPPMDQVLGNDRALTSPSVAVDNSAGARRGTIYLVYASNDARDGADIVFQKSTDDGQSFSAPVPLNAAPGNDRAQWFPWVTVDSSTGRVHVFYYDQGIADSGDLTEVSYVHSDDGGTTWSAPVPLTRRPFRAGWGNDASQPNLGKYNQATAQGGELFAAFAVTARPPAGFVDGKPSAFMTVPDVEFRRVSESRPGDLNSLPLSIHVDSVGFTDSGGNGHIDPGETIRLRVPLENYTLNPLALGRAQNVLALLISDTPGVQVIQPLGLYGTIETGRTVGNRLEYRLRIAPSFELGTLIDLRLLVAARFGSRPITVADLRHTLFSGTPAETLLLGEDFDGVPTGMLPSGWIALHGAGHDNVRWKTGNAFCGNASNAAFHPNADDGPPGGSSARWEVLSSPAIPIPADADHVTVDFDVCTNTEDAPDFDILAFDGMFLRVVDLTPGSGSRSVLVEAFADEFTTGAIKHYPKHLPRSLDPLYFDDMSVWAGDSLGPKHVHLELPGMAGTTVQLRFEYTQDEFGTCLDLGRGPICGVSVDHVAVRSVRAVQQP